MIKFYLPIFLIGFCSACQSSESTSEPSFAAHEPEAWAQWVQTEFREAISNGTLSQVFTEIQVRDCEFVMTRRFLYRRNREPYGGFDKDVFRPAWTDQSSLPLAMIDLEKINAEAEQVQIRSKNQSKDVRTSLQFAMAYRSYYQALHGIPHDEVQNFRTNMMEVLCQNSNAAKQLARQVRRLAKACQQN